MKKVLITLVLVVGAQMYFFAQTAPNFTVTDTKGVTHRLYEDYLNQGKTVVLDLFFVACPPCNTRAPQIQQIYEDWGSGNMDVQIFDMSTRTWDDDAAVLGFENQHGLTYPGVSKDGGSIDAVSFYTSDSRFFATPTFIVIDPRDKSIEWLNNTSTLLSRLEAAIEATGAEKEPVQLTEVSGKVQTISGKAIPNVDIVVQGYENQSVTTDNDGEFFMDLPLNANQNYVVIAESSDNNFKSGITTLDMAKVLKHVLSVELLANNFEEIAADANNSRSISTLDVVAIRKLILNVASTAPGHTTPWKFFPQSGSNSFNSNTPQNLNFIGVKIGDVNDSIQF